MIAGLMSVAFASPAALDRVDLVSESVPTWLLHEAHRIDDTPSIVVLRYLEQVTPVISAGAAQLGLSLRTQWVGVEPTLATDWFGSAALLTGAGLPNGARVGVAWRPGKVRVGASLVLLSSATWARPDYTTWSVLPGLGIGAGRDVGPRAPWMR